MARPAKSLLKDSHPELAFQVKDKSLLSTLATGSDKKIVWIGDCGHEWSASVSNRTNPNHPTGCPLCAGKVVVRGINDLATTHPDIAALCKFPEDAYTHSAYSNKSIWWTCENGHDWQAPIARLTTQGCKCPICINRRVVQGVNDLATSNPEIASELADPSLAHKLSAGSNNRVEWICKNDPNHKWIATVYSRVSKGTGCPYCSGRLLITGVNDLATTHPDLVKTLKNVEEGKYVRFNSERKLEWVCENNPDHIWTATPRNRSVSGCPICANRTIVPGENDLATTDPELASELVDPSLGKKLSRGSGIPVEWKCEKGHIWTAPPCRRTGANHTGCPMCSLAGMSKSEKELGDVVTLLAENKAVFENDRTFLHGRFELDIVVPEAFVAVEYNGIRWHSTEFKSDKDYHYKKFKQCRNKQFRLIQVWEDEWKNDKLSVIVELARALNTSTKTLNEVLSVYDANWSSIAIDAADCECKNLTVSEVLPFLNKYGNGISDIGMYNIALCNNDTIHALMTVSIENNVMIINRILYGSVVNDALPIMIKFVESTLSSDGFNLNKCQVKVSNDRLLANDLLDIGFKVISVDFTESYVNSKDWTRKPNKESDADYVIYDSGISTMERKFKSDIPKIVRKDTYNYDQFKNRHITDFREFANQTTDADPMHNTLSPVKFRCDVNKIGNFSKVTRYYQFDTFYNRELAIWNANANFRGMPVREYLFANRLKYLGKKPEELTDIEILRGLTISGVLKGYTVFDSSLMDKVIKKYNIKSVYDPCAGWGERMLCCHTNKVKYTGVDINEALEDGYTRMISDLNVNAKFIVGDSSKVKAASGYDAVITCPPYWNIEKYTNKGAENLPYDEFLVWWDKVVKNSVSDTTEYFCFQINQRFSGDMIDIVKKNGFELVEEFSYSNNKSSHFTRKNGNNTKKEHDTMYVFKKK